MKRTWLFALASFAVVVILVSAIVLHGTRFPANAQTAVQDYLSYRYAADSAPIVEHPVRAAHPSVLRPDQSGPTYGNNAFYAVSHTYGQASSGPRVLPYPPDEIWCVHLNPAQADKSMLLVALHIDLYNAAWVVHELPADWTQTERGALLSDIGCPVN